MIIKIQSVSDIITNSSSEVFMCVDEYTIGDLYKSIGDLLKAFGVNEPIKKVLSIEPEYDINTIDAFILDGHNPNYWIRDEVPYPGYPLAKTKEEITDEMRQKAMYDLNELTESTCTRPAIENIKITAKDPKYDSICKALFEIATTIKYEERNI